MSEAKHDTAEWAKDREACERATEGPWTWEKDDQHSWPDSCVCGPVNRKPGKHETPIICDTNYEPDGTFIARARTRWPVALDEIARLRAELADTRRKTVEECLSRIDAYVASRDPNPDAETRGWSAAVVREIKAALRALLDGKEGGR